MQLNWLRMSLCQTYQRLRQGRLLLPQNERTLRMKVQIQNGKNQPRLDNYEVRAVETVANLLLLLIAVNPQGPEAAGPDPRRQASETLKAILDDQKSPPPSDRVPAGRASDDNLVVRIEVESAKRSVLNGPG